MKRSLQPKRCTKYFSDSQNLIVYYNIAGEISALIGVYVNYAAVTRPKLSLEIGTH